MRLSTSACIPGFFTCLTLSITTALFLLWTLKNSECSFAKGAFCLRSWGDQSIQGRGTSKGVELQSIPSTTNSAKSGALRLSATLDAVRNQNEKEILLMESNSILERTVDLEREFAPRRHLKSSKSDESGKGGKGSYSDESGKGSKTSKKSKRKSYEDDDYTFVIEDGNSTSYDTKSRKSSKKLFQDSSDSKKSDQEFVVVLRDFSEASESNVIESFGSSKIMEKDITLLLTVPSETDIYLIEGMVVTVRRDRNLIAASDFTCPPSSYDRHVKEASGRLFFRIPGDVNSVTVFCDDDENVIGIYVHVVVRRGEDTSPGSTPAPVTAESPTVAPPTSEEPTSIAVAATPLPTEALVVTAAPTVDTNLTDSPTVSDVVAVPTLAVAATPSPTITPVPTEGEVNATLFSENDFDLFI